MSSKNTFIFGVKQNQRFEQQRQDLKNKQQFKKNLEQDIHRLLNQAVNGGFIDRLEIELERKLSILSKLKELPAIGE